MATAIMRLPDMSTTLTPPPSDRGECDDTTLLNTDAYLPEVFYPSPAPSYSQQQRAGYSPHSPELDHRNSIYESVDNDSQHMMFAAEPSAVQMYPAATAPQNLDMYPSDLTTYPPFEQSPWLQSSAFANPNSLYPYPSEDPISVFGTYVSQAPTNIIPPTPQTVTGGSFNFNEAMRPQDSLSFLSSFSSSMPRHHSPSAPSTASAGDCSSRSCSPSMSVHAPSDSQSSRGMRLSSGMQRSSSSSLHAYGIPIRTPGSATVQAWRCAYPNCTSRAVFTRGCDLRKHYNRHSKHLFCRVDGCPQSEAACITAAQQQAVQAGAEPSDPSKLVVTGGFSSKKDRARHEAKHNPGIKCEWRGPNGEECGRLFSRMDNMKDHVRRIHNKGQNLAVSTTSSKGRSR